MLYTELLNLTDGKATYEQFLEIEADYMKKDAMTKAQAASLWKRRYGEKENKPRVEEMRRIKEAIRSFKHERQFAKELERRTIKAHEEKVKTYIEENNVELDEYGNCKEWYAQQALKRWENELPKAIYNLYQDFGNDTTIYIIYKDGSTLYVSGAEIVGGDVTPKMQGIAYAHYMDGYEDYDTEIGSIYTGLYGKTLEELNFDITDEMCEQKQTYENEIEIKYGTECGIKHKENQAAA